MSESTEQPAPAAAPKGWYPFEDEPGKRYWDGTAWTEHYDRPKAPGDPKARHPDGGTMKRWTSGVDAEWGSYFAPSGRTSEVHVHEGPRRWRCALRTAIHHRGIVTRERLPDWPDRGGKHFEAERLFQNAHRGVVEFNQA